MLAINRKRWYRGNIINEETFTISDWALESYVNEMKNGGYEAFGNQDGTQELVFWVSENFSVTETVTEIEIPLAQETNLD